LFTGFSHLDSCHAVTGATGFKISKDRKGTLIGKKKKRMPFIVMIGVFIMRPTAIVLDMWASTSQFGTKFCQIRVNQGKGKKDRIVPFPSSFKELLAMHADSLEKKGATYLF
jgi:hypothetical protein